MKVKHSWKKAFCLSTVTGLVFIVLLGAAESKTGDEGELSFQWAFAALTGSAAERKLLPVTKDTVLKSGDQLKMMIELNEPGYIYILYNGSNGEIIRLMPENLDSNENELQVGRKQYLPEGNQWFTLDDQTGIEKFYLLASKSPLTELEVLLKRYEKATAQDKTVIGDDVRKHITQTRKQKRQLATVAQRPVEIGGSFRSVPNAPLTSQDISLFAVEISGDEFFARTFTIEHR